jgi:phosphatidylinositol-3,4,5-trisphosphate 3-phosphatase/dual-specificity protein phosphatase PTEN
MDYEKPDVEVRKKVNKAWCVKRLVSKKKRRFENEKFDLDMAYVTKRVIAMGFPATGFEKMYRNSIEDITEFFHYYHNDNVKIYNLCLEKERIYDKSLFAKSQVGLFPGKDHNPCPIKLILEFCVDIILYLIKNQEGVASVHCKAGKGRTGVMICCYLVFSGLCKNADEAFEHYAKSRTYNGKVKIKIYKYLIII